VENFENFQVLGHISQNGTLTLHVPKKKRKKKAQKKRGVAKA
jgi:hypothetical protein